MAARVAPAQADGEAYAEGEDEQGERGVDEDNGLGLLRELQAEAAREEEGEQGERGEVVLEGGEFGGQGGDGGDDGEEEGEC